MNIHLPNPRAGRHTTEMEILENPLEWLREFQDGWLSKLENTGAIDWSLYSPPQNQSAPNSRGIKLSESRLMLITTAGIYHPDKQDFFNSAHPIGDYTIRQVPTATPSADLSISHPDLDLSYANQDREVVLPLTHLAQMVQEGTVGSLAPIFISYSGFQPHAIRIVKELIPAILKAIKQYHVHAALIIPAGTLSVQSAGLVARALEVNHIATTMTCWNGDLARRTAPPRGTATTLPSDSPVGLPGNFIQQRRLLEATLSLLERDAPTGIIDLDLDELT
jgi:hypothetical protein